MNFTDKSGRTRFPHRLVLWAVCVAVASPSFAGDSEWQADARRLAYEADLVVMGTVQKAVSSWDDSGRVIVTRTTLQTHRCFKGPDRRTIAVETLGGTVGGIGMAVSHGATLKHGETAVLFLRRSRDGSHHVVWGGRRGKLPVRVTPTDKRLIGRGKGVGEETFADWIDAAGP